MTVLILLVGQDNPTTLKLSNPKALSINGSALGDTDASAIATEKLVAVAIGDSTATANPRETLGAVAVGASVALASLRQQIAAAASGGSDAVGVNGDVISGVGTGDSVASAVARQILGATAVGGATATAIVRQLLGGVTVGGSHASAAPNDILRASAIGGSDTSADATQLLLGEGVGDSEASAIPPDLPQPQPPDFDGIQLPSAGYYRRWARLQLEKERTAARARRLAAATLAPNLAVTGEGDASGGSHAVGRLTQKQRTQGRAITGSHAHGRAHVLVSGEGWGSSRTTGVLVTRDALEDDELIFAAIAAVEAWRNDDDDGYGY